MKITETVKCISRVEVCKHNCKEQWSGGILDSTVNVASYTCDKCLDNDLLSIVEFILTTQ